MAILPPIIVSTLRSITVAIAPSFLLLPPLTIKSLQSDRSTDDEDMAAFRSNPMYGASGLAFELPETSADEDAAPAAPPSTARLSSATGSLRRLSSNSFDLQTHRSAAIQSEHTPPHSCAAA